MGIQLFPVYDIGTKVVEHFKLPNLQNDNVVFRLHYLVRIKISKHKNLDREDILRYSEIEKNK